MHFPNNTLFNNCLELSLVLFRPFKLAMLAIGMALLLMPPATFGQGYLEEIVVTARKRAESMQDTPVSVTAFTREQLDLYNIINLHNLSEFTPGLVISDSGSASGGSIAMRGVATGTGNPSFDQTVAVVFDNVAVNNAYIMKVSQIDMQQVEVLKGPQALFFGKNSPGGVISFQTADPGDEFEMSVRTGFEFNADELFAEAVISGPITDTLGARLVVYTSDMDGWVDNIATDTAVTDASPYGTFPNREELFVRGTLVFEPNESLRMRTKISYNDYDGDDTAHVQLVSCPGGFGPMGSPCKADDEDVQQLLVADFADQLQGVDREERTQVDWLVVGHEIEYQINDGLQLVSVTSRTESNNDGYADALSGLPAGLLATTGIRHENFAQELRLASSYDGHVNFMLGAYYGDGETSSRQEPYFWLGPGVVFPLGATDPIFTVDHETYSFFGELVWDITDQLVLSAGVRYSDESREFIVNEGGADFSDRVRRNRDNTNTSPEVSLTWKPTDNSTYFISYREGFKSGGHNSVFRSGGYSSVPAGMVIDQSYNPETVEGVEGGFKLDLLDNRLRFNASAFYYEYTDMQVSAFDSTALVQRVLNAGEATIQGAEFELLYLPEGIEDLSLSLGVAYTDSTFDEFSGRCYVGQTSATGCLPVDVGLPSQRNEQGLSGEGLPYAPEFTLNAGARYNTQLSDDWSLGAAVSVLYSDSYIHTATYGPTEYQDSFTKVNASLTLGYQENWEFSLIGNNLTDEYTVGGGGNAPTFPAFHTAAVVSRGQQIALQAKWSY